VCCRELSKKEKDNENIPGGNPHVPIHLVIFFIYLFFLNKILKKELVTKPHNTIGSSNCQSNLITPLTSIVNEVFHEVWR